VKVGDLIKLKKHGTLGIIVRMKKAAQVDDIQLYVTWVNTGKRGTCWGDEVEVISESR